MKTEFLNVFEQSNLERWMDSGLLEGLDEKTAAIVANKLEETAVYLTSEKCPYKEDNRISTVAFPAVRRILAKEQTVKLNIPEFLSELSFEYNRAAPEFTDFSKIDMEAEFLANWCDKYINNCISSPINEEKKRMRALAGIKVL